ncbi:MAG: bifunctional (p)ppGpp synthetase/guanosine-3',5'-bis(diphosphate) 3'-pyrophosphohydrolase [Chrysiogenetes bacterium]|nr:bifunctional (p)ppGpp synthetase/guanosine-3',5'-bis(diphosphate) 3'-pyrophosphohydrolase [Chrysiogenetes bacterium]
MLRFNDISERVQAYNPKADLLSLQKAYVFSAKVHSGQKRRSGEAYLIHPVEVAGILTQLRLDVPSVATGLLHDTVEDTLATLEEIEGLFGKEIRDLVDAVTKLSQVEYKNKEERQAENFRKMLLATSKDLRVILIKLADRLHNMRTLEHLPEEKQQRIAEETLAIYAPIANRLGIQWVKTELEDLCFKVLQPDAFAELESEVTMRQRERQGIVDELCDTVRAQLSNQAISCTVYGRAKHFYSIYRKMQEKNLTFDEIYDSVAFRVIVPSVRACYETLGHIHSLWKPIPGKVKDYIALPKANMYQSLHTAVIGPYGQAMEFQIRTPEMHDVAEYGIAAHWKYKEGKIDGSVAGEDSPYSALRQIFADQNEVTDPDEYMESLRIDFFPDEVYVFTPQGDVRVLPKGATPIDFAYAIHSEVGNTCIGAKVNGKIVQLQHELETGDIVAITTRNTQTPSRDWLKWVKTSKARGRIREYIRHTERERSVVLGREILEKELSRQGLQYERLRKQGQLERVAKELDYRDVEKLLIAVSYGTAPLSKIVDILLPPEKRRAPREERPQPVEALQKFIQRVSGNGSTGVRVKGGEGDVMIRFARCCNPLPGDKIIGFITRGRGISVHRTDCQHVHEMIPERKISVEWDKESRAARPVTVEVVCADKPGLLASMTKSITTEDANISRVELQTTIDEKAVGTFEIAVRDADHLKRIIKALQRIKGIYSVHRVDTNRQAHL